MKKKRLFKSLVLLFSSSLALGTFLSLQLAHKKDNINVALAYEGTPLPTSGTLSAGTYYLSSNLTVSSQLKITSGDVIVNLNGWTLNGGGRDKGIFHVTGGTLTVNGKDDGTGNRGTLNDGGGYYPGEGYSYGGALYITAGGATFNDLNITNCQSNWGGAISMSNSAVTLNNCNLSKNKDTNGYGFYGVIRVGDSSSAGQGLTVNGGEMFSNDGAISVGNKAKVTINGAYIHDNEKLGVTVDTEGSLKISGNTIIEDNQPSSIRNLALNNAAKIGIVSELGENASIGVTMSGTKGVFTNNTDTTLNDPSKFVSDNPDYAIGVYPAGHTEAGQLFIGNKVTVTYTTEHGTAPASDAVANGSIIYNEPTSPSQEGCVFKGWYKDDGFENVWNFETDTVTSNTTLYAKWDYDEATANVIKLINDIGDLTYTGGANDSLDDIIAAKAAYDALTPGRKEVVDGVNKDVLDHDIVTYNHVDKVGDLIKAIPEACDSQEYYDAVDAALAAYNALTDEEKAILNAALDFQYKKTLEDNITAKEVIELIQGIGEVTYKGGQDDSKDDINDALDAYNNLTDDQKAIVDNANKDELDDAKETYDNVDEAVNLINSIGDINHGGENDSKDAVDAAREAYDALSDEGKALVNSYNDSTQTLKDAEEVYDVLVKIDDIGEGDDDEKIKTARDAYDALTQGQKDQISDKYVQKLIAAEKRSRETNQQANILFIVFLILFILLIVSGLIVMYVLLKRRKDENNDNNKQVKLASVSGLLPIVILASYFTSTKFIILYVLAAVAILIWLTNLVLFVTKKRQKEVKVEAKPEAVVVSEPQVTQTELVNEDDEEVETITDEKGNIFEIRYIKSFTAKLSQSEDIVKDYYTILKNYVLSYKDSHSRVSWHYDAVNVGRDYVLKFAIRGKTLCVYYALDASKLDEKYKVEEAKGKKFEDVPCLYRIKNDRRLDYAKELIDLLMSENAISKGSEQNEDYHVPTESTEVLIANGFIKEVIKHYESISASKADEEMSDEKAESFIEEVEVIKPRKGSKEIINIDTLSENYNNGDEVTLESLIKKGLVPATTGRIKVLARGVLDKKLDVIANDFSIPAIKMIVLVGGHVKRIK